MPPQITRSVTSLSHPTAGKTGLRWHLRAATEQLHAEADKLGAGYDLRTPDGYREFLLAHARALPGLEAACDAAGLQRFLPDWPGRRRAAALASDLARLGLAMPPALPAALPAGPAVLGAAYVLEGSRLGNAMLLRIAQGSPALAECDAFAYLSHKPQGEGWPGFLRGLEDSLPEPAEWAAAAEGARFAFTCFLAAMRRETIAEPMPYA